MDNNLIIILICVNILSNMFNGFLLLMQSFIKSIKKSKCCSSELLMRHDTPDDVIDISKDKIIEIPK